MARMHTKKRGKSASQKPFNRSASWVAQTPEEVEELVVKYAKEGNSEATIGRIVRDVHSIPSVRTVAKKTISQILVEKNLAPKYPTDLIDLIRRAVAMRTHLKSNNRDVQNATTLNHVEAKIKRLVKYYRGSKLPQKWKYDPEQAELLVK